MFTQATAMFATASQSRLQLHLPEITSYLPLVIEWQDTRLQRITNDTYKPQQQQKKRRTRWLSVSVACSLWATVGGTLLALSECAVEGTLHE